jgi:hypothetical protein
VDRCMAAPGAAGARRAGAETGKVEDLPVAVVAVQLAVDVADVRTEVLEAVRKRGGADSKLDPSVAEEQWSDFVAEVVIFVETSGEPHSSAVAAGAGLVTFGATSRAKLVRVAGQPPDVELFRRTLRAEGVLPAVCDLLWGEYVAPSQTTSSRSPPAQEMNRARGAVAGAAVFEPRKPESCCRCCCVWCAKDAAPEVAWTCLCRFLSVAF